MKQITNQLVMVRPAHFGFNEETAINNSFQFNDIDIPSPALKAQAEFDVFVNKLLSAGVEVMVIQDSDQPVKPDCVFPNNWVSFHEDGQVVLYPMFAENRRIERNNNVVESLAEKFNIKSQKSYVSYEDQDKFLEGTGSLVLDRVNKIVYACMSLRTNEELLDIWCRDNDYTKVVFDAKDENNEPIYHTNVMMALGENFCVICLDSFSNIHERENVIDMLEETEKEIIEISCDQMNQFAGNMLQLKGKDGPIVVMSTAAYNSLNDHQLNALKKDSTILYSDLTTIETLGGGSARCMMAEVFLPLK